jgi:hypothetical protein
MNIKENVLNIRKYILYNKNFVSPQGTCFKRVKRLSCENNKQLEKIINDLNKLNINYNIKYIDSTLAYTSHTQDSCIEYVIIKYQSDKMESLLLNYKLKGGINNEKKN